MSFSHAKDENEIINLINKGHQINKRNGLGQTELHRIVQKRPDLIQPMLSNGANPNLCDRLGRNPIFYAKDRDCVECLVLGGSSVIVKDLLGQYSFEVNKNVKNYINTSIFLEGNPKLYLLFNSGNETPIPDPCKISEIYNRFVSS